MRALHLSFTIQLRSIAGICLCLFLVLGSIIMGTEVSDAAATGSPPEIVLFSADPTTVNDGDSVLYSFVVRNTTALQISESGDVIKLIKSVQPGALKGTVRGRTTYQIRTGNINSFDAILVASNEAGKREKKITIKFATETRARSTSGEAGQTGAADNQTRSPQWLDQITPAMTSRISGASRPGSEPSFFKCPDNCNYCLKPDDAANRGFTQRCSEQPCYYSPDNQQKWYCYSKPSTIWCCKDGKVVEMTKEQCTQIGGSYYATEAEATKACQQMLGWYCRGGTVYQGTQAQAAQIGAVWYTSQAEASRACNPTGWCCKDGKIGQTTQSQCAQLGGYWFDTEAEAARACQSPACWCCVNGKVGQATQAQCYQMGGTCYNTQSQAMQACQQAIMGWYCVRGNLYQGTQAQAAQAGATWYASQSQAASVCQQQSSCWCCSGGKVFQTTQAACIRSQGTCFSDQASATKACYRLQLK